VITDGLDRCLSTRGSDSLSPARVLAKIAKPTGSKL
jgi:hypothetical protein